VPNLLVGVVENGRLIWSQHFGPQQVDTHTVYRIGSITKVSRRLHCFSFAMLASLRSRTALTWSVSEHSYLSRGGYGTLGSRSPRI
jgi:hypothetical protein